MLTTQFTRVYAVVSMHTFSCTFIHNPVEWFQMTGKCTKSRGLDNSVLNLPAIRSIFGAETDKNKFDIPSNHPVTKKKILRTFLKVCH